MVSDFSAAFTAAKPIRMVRLSDGILKMKKTDKLFTESSLREETVSSREAYSGSFLHVYHDEVSLPNGGGASREYIRHVGAVCIVALDEQGRIAMERQYRYPVGETVYEIPAGKLDS